MCDYSLYQVENRLAQEGEQLVLHRFSTGTLGFASVCDLERELIRKAAKTGLLTTFKDCLLGERTPRVPAICIPPGARLLLAGVPQGVQEALQIGPSEVVVFTEISSRSHSYRDALLLPNNTKVLLQDLSEGMYAVVLSVSLKEDFELETEEACVRVAR